MSNKPDRVRTTIVNFDSTYDVDIVLSFLGEASSKGYRYVNGEKVPIHFDVDRRNSLHCVSMREMDSMCKMLMDDFEKACKSTTCIDQEDSSQPSDDNEHYSDVSKKAVAMETLEKSFEQDSENTTMVKISSDEPQKTYDLAILIVHADESRLNINEQSAGVGYYRMYKTLRDITGDKVLVIIGGDTTFDCNSVATISPKVQYKISGQFDENYIHGPKGLVFSWHMKHSLSHLNVLLKCFGAAIQTAQGPEIQTGFDEDNANIKLEDEHLSKKEQCSVPPSRISHVKCIFNAMRSKCIRICEKTPKSFLVKCLKLGSLCFFYNFCGILPITMATFSYFVYLMCKRRTVRISEYIQVASFSAFSLTVLGFTLLTEGLQCVKYSISPLYYYGIYFFNTTNVFNTIEL